MPSLKELHRGLSAIDTILGRTMAINPMERLGRIEGMLHRYLLAEWQSHIDDAAKKAGKAVLAGDQESAINAVVADEMSQWADDVVERFSETMLDTYELGKEAIFERRRRRLGPLIYSVEKAKASISPSLTLKDRRAIKQLTKHQLFWIGDYYDVNVSETVAATIRRVMLEAGADRAVAAKVMERELATTLSHVSLPSGWHGTDRSYLEGLTANATTVARVAGKVSMLRSAGAEAYVIQAVNDDRTCPICSYMDGKEFLVREGDYQVNSLIAAGSKEEIQTIAPWLPFSSIQAMSSGPGNQGRADSASLSQAGMSLPPFHFKCRCTLDIA